MNKLEQKVYDHIVRLEDDYGKIDKYVKKHDLRHFSNYKNQCDLSKYIKSRYYEKIDSIKMKLKMTKIDVESGNSYFHYSHLRNSINYDSGLKTAIKIFCFDIVSYFRSVRNYNRFIFFGKVSSLKFHFKENIVLHSKEEREKIEQALELLDSVLKNTTKETLKLEDEIDFLF